MKPNRIGQIAIPAAIVGIVVMMVVPLPTALLDLLLVTNIALALLALLASMFTTRVLDFSIFPSYLLIATLFRLALNVSVTRLVLLHGYAGKVIESFGHFVVGGSVIVGLVIFLILIVIQFIVITNGAGRVAEVAARFTLDAMPGKQMAIDADLNSGLINDDEAKRRRREVAEEADFYGAMDGASKFVKGDAIAAIVIVVDQPRRRVRSRHPATAPVVRRGDQDLQPPDRRRRARRPDPGAAHLAVVRPHRHPGRDRDGPRFRPAAPVHAAQEDVAARRRRDLRGRDRPGSAQDPVLHRRRRVCCLLATRLPSDDEIAAQAAAAKEVEVAPVELSPDSPEHLVGEMRVEPLELEIAYDLIDLVDASKGGDLLDRVRALRRKLALELGVVIPLVRTRDNLELPASTYAVRVNGVDVGRGEAPAGHVLVLGDDAGSLPGIPTREPVFGLPATWVPIEFRHQAEITGATVVDRASVITTHLAEVVRRNAGRLLSRQDVKMLIDVVKQSDPVVIDELNGANVTTGEIQRVLQMLLDEAVGIRDLVRIFEVDLGTLPRDEGPRTDRGRRCAPRSAPRSRRRTRRTASSP